MFRLVLSCLALLSYSSLAYGVPTMDKKGPSGCFLAPTNQTQDLVKTAMNNCLTKLKLSESDLHGGEEEDDKCLSKCLASELKWVDSTGQINKDTILSYLSDHTTPESLAKLEPVMNTCVEEFEKQMEATDSKTSCTAYQDTKRCVMKGFVKLCGHE